MNSSLIRDYLEVSFGEDAQRPPLFYSIPEAIDRLVSFEAFTLRVVTAIGSTPAVQLLWLNKAGVVRYLGGTPALAANVSSTLSFARIGATQVVGNTLMIAYPRLTLLPGDRMQLALVGGLGSDDAFDGLLTLVRRSGLLDSLEGKVTF